MTFPTDGYEEADTQVFERINRKLSRPLSTIAKPESKDTGTFYGATIPWATSSVKKTNI